MLLFKEWQNYQKPTSFNNMDACHPTFTSMLRSQTYQPMLMGDDNNTTRSQQHNSCNGSPTKSMGRKQFDKLVCCANNVAVDELEPSLSHKQLMHGGQYCM
jgi:hypothetical protein